MNNSNYNNRCKILFVHDIKVFKDEFTNYYSDGSYNMNVWEKYLMHSSDLSILADVVSISSDSAHLYNIIDKGRINIIELKSKGKSKIEKFMNFFQNSATKKIIRLAVSNADLIFLRMPSTRSYSAFKYGAKMKKKMIVEVVGHAFNALWYHSMIGKILAPINFIKMKSIVKKAQNVIYVTEKYLQKDFPNSNNNIACSDIDLSDSISYSKREYFKNKIVRIGMIGKLDVKYKGHEILINAIESLRDDFDLDFKIELVGSGSRKILNKHIQKRNIKTNIEFLETMRHDEVFKWLSNLDIYVQPSLTEGLPRSVIEAMASRCIVVGSNVGGIPELLGVSMIFKKKNESELIKIISGILSGTIDIDHEIEKNTKKISSYLTNSHDKKRYEYINDIIRDMNIR